MTSKQSNIQKEFQANTQDLKEHVIGFGVYGAFIEAAAYAFGHVSLAVFGVAVLGVGARCAYDWYQAVHETPKTS